MGADRHLDPTSSRNVSLLRSLGLSILLVSNGLVAPPVLAGQWAFSGSAALATGDDGAGDSVETWSLLGELTYRSERWRIGAGLPLVRQDSSALGQSGGVLSPVPHPGAGPTHGTGHFPPPTDPGSDSEPDSRDDAEWGDLVIWAELAPTFSLPTGFHLSALALAKAPTADRDTGSGTGQWDVGGGARLGWGYGLSWATLDLVYWKMGDLPEQDLRDVISGALVVGRRSYEGPWLFEGVLRGQTSALEGASSALSVGGVVWRWISPNSRLGLGGFAGLTDGTPDLAVRLTWTTDRWPERWLPGKSE